jgi:hypothetical protein
MLAGVDFSARPTPADLGRVERALLDAGRRGVPGRGTMVLEHSPTQDVYAMQLSVGGFRRVGT